MRRLPGLDVLRRYEIGWLRHDIVAGLVLTTMLVPVGIAYAVASGVPGIYGLYATIVALLVYALFGPSRILVLGPDSSLAAIILGVVLPLSGGDPLRAISLAAMMAVVSGSLCILAGVARLGFVTELLSKPIRYGYMNGIALTVLISQVPKLFGFSIDGDGPLRNLWGIAEALVGGRANWTAFAVGGCTLAVILLLKGSKRVPGILIAVAGATAVTAMFDLAGRAGVSVLGRLPEGLPAFAIPWIGYGDIVPVLIGGGAVALVSFADTSVLSRTYAARTRTQVDPNQEMVALGAANLAAGFFQGFPISSSSSRTPVAESAGARTQLTGVVGAIAVALLLVFAPGLLRHLPSPALAAVVIASAIGLIEVSDLRRIYRIQRWEFWLSIVCFVGVAVLGAIPGIGLAIVIAVIEFLWDGWRPHSAVLGRAEGVEGYHDITRYPDARRIPGLVLFRWDAPLFFANAELFKERALAAVAASPTKARWLVVAAEPVTSVDVTAADTLVELDEALRAAGAELRFAELKDPVKDKLKRFGLYARIGTESFFPTIENAVSRPSTRTRSIGSTPRTAPAAREGSEGAFPPLRGGLGRVDRAQRECVPRGRQNRLSDAPFASSLRSESPHPDPPLRGGNARYPDLQSASQSILPGEAPAPSDVSCLRGVLRPHGAAEREKAEAADRAVGGQPAQLGLQREARLVAADREQVIARLVRERAATGRGRRRADHRHRAARAHQAGQRTDMVVAVHDQLRPDAADDRLELFSIGEIAAGLRPADVRRVVDEDDAEAVAILAERAKNLLGGLALAPVEAPGGDEGQRRDRRGQADKGDRPPPTHVGKDLFAAVVAAGEGADRGQQAFEGARHIGVVVAGDEAHRFGRSEAVEEEAGGRPFVRQSDVGDVAGAGDVIGLLRADVADEGGEKLHVVHGAAGAPPVHPAGEALVQKVPEGRPRQRTDMRVGEMGEAEHPHPATRRECLSSDARASAVKRCRSGCPRGGRERRRG
jgi:high affinity sulfate transporter 1